MKEYLSLGQMNLMINTNHELDWPFNMHSPAQFGRLWISAVKSMKSRLKKSASKAVLAFSMLQNMIIQAEVCLYSWPLCLISSDTLDVFALK